MEGEEKFASNTVQHTALLRARLSPASSRRSQSASQLRDVWGVWEEVSQYRLRWVLQAGLAKVLLVL